MNEILKNIINDGKVKKLFPDWKEMEPGNWSDHNILIKLGHSFLEIGLYREAGELGGDPEPGSYTLQIFYGDDVIFCERISDIESRYMAMLGPNTKQFWLYDDIRDKYIDPPMEILNELEKIRWKDGVETAESIKAAQDRLVELANEDPDWLYDGHEYEGYIDI